MLASPVSDDIFLFMASAVAASEVGSAAAAAVVAPSGGEEAAPLTAAAFEEAPAEPAAAAAAAAAAGDAGRPPAWSPTTPGDGLEFAGMDRVDSGFFSCENEKAALSKVIEASPEWGARFISPHETYVYSPIVLILICNNSSLSLWRGIQCVLFAHVPCAQAGNAPRLTA